MPYCILRTAKLKTPANIAASLNHTFRNRQTDNADPARKALNEPSDGRTAVEILSGMAARWPDKRRRDAVLCIEYLIAASPEYFQEGQTGAAYFDAARQWLIDQHGAENVIFSAVHRDELTPHMAAYIVPIREGRLNAKHWMGGKAKLSTMQTEFAQEVAKPFGLDRGIKGSKAHHTTVREFYAAINAPAPVAPDVEIGTPPLFGRDGWAKAEGERIAAVLRPAMDYADKAAKWGQLQDKRRRDALVTAKHQESQTKAVQKQMNKLEADNQRLQETVAAWVGAFNAGLTDDQAAQLLELAAHMREENRAAVRGANVHTSSVDPVPSA
jgi:hypothetical protein